ncbi:hypothetical protein EJ04DRAFT_101798 [Polyplosphaeria fusca]|uniref:Uncharacterized protein n=1 Tax=Polyplosphaeria fusca TaxID=682080 RepID=A0A9P4QJ88_9PLEO|nr:hypothetical protein EJ04DRAFT_101798 [Polyplosphaeria fusca]
MGRARLVMMYTSTHAWGGCSIVIKRFGETYFLSLSLTIQLSALCRLASDAMQCTQYDFTQPHSFPHAQFAPTLLPYRAAPLLGISRT